jgi:hypothetical protein
MKRIVFAICLALVMSGFAVAQEKPKADSKEGKSDAPTLSDESKRAIDAVQKRAVGLTEAIGVLQKELDAQTGAWNRLMQSLQVEGYVLDLQRMAYVKAPDPKKPQ